MKAELDKSALDGDWTSANQALLVGEFRRLAAHLGDGAVDDARASARALRDRMPAPSAIDTLVTLFELSDFERDILLLAAGLEMDEGLSMLVANLSGNRERGRATFGLALDALPNPHWSAITPVEPLRRWRLLDLVDIDHAGGVTAAKLRLDERVLHFITGINYLDHRLSPIVESVAAPGLMDEEHRSLASRIARQLREHAGRLPVVMLEGDDESGQSDVARTVASELGIALFRLRGADVPSAPHEQASLAGLWQREAALLGAGILVTAPDVDTAAPVSRFVERIDGLVLVAGPECPRVEAGSFGFAVRKPDPPGQRRLWQAALGRTPMTPEAVDGLASQYRLGARAIERFSGAVRGDDPEVDLRALHHQCHSGGMRAGPLAQPIATSASWEDLVLPDAQRRTLEQIVVHARHRIRVHHDWGFAGKSNRGLGIATLFSGESGTGKTLAAEVMANELDLRLYRIDLSAVISKYIGETEKNLRTVFDAAEDVGAVLLFDEADALFGKRSEVRDSHDRYANIEVSYLLQRMEAYRGLAILTTNHKSALDSAFGRRLRFVVHFPFPDQAQRMAIWKSVFPADTPLSDLDYPKLARLNVTGGEIRNVALGAAFMAAEAGYAVTMAHLLRAAHIEAAKRERPPSDAETRGWV